MSTLYILPNQLYSFNEYYKKVIEENDINKIIMWEHPHFFKEYNFNKKKLILHRASMKCFYDKIRDKIKNIDYIEFSERHKIVSDSVGFDSIDKIKNYKLKKIIESPNFLFSEDMYKEYFKKNNGKKSKGLLFTTMFYKYGKNKLNVLKNEKSYDKENRENLTTEEEISKIPKFPVLNKENKYIEEAKRYVENNFKNNYGNVNDFIFPITHEDAKDVLNDFIKNKFDLFGKYEDAIVKDELTLYHSVLSSSLNIGLINPHEIIKEIEKIKSKIPMNSYEGYVRQLFWREYQRYCYRYYEKEISESDYFNFKKKLYKKWYDGDTKIEIIDDTIKKAFDKAYLHHIERLMVIGNFMILNEIKPKEGYKWFMEFAIDSYRWVMCQNVYDMVFFNTGGLTMRRPYISKSNYILKMSNYKKDNWVDKWDLIYDKFTKKYKTKLLKFRYYIRF